MPQQIHQHHQGIYLHWFLVLLQASPTTDQDVLDGDLHSQAGSNDRATRNMEQLGYPQGHIGKLGYPGYQMLPHPDIGDAVLDS